MSKRRVLGSADDDIAFFCIFWQFYWSFFCCSWACFLANTCIFYIFKYEMAFFCISWKCLLFMKRFVCKLHAYSSYLQYMEDTGRSKMRQEFWSFRGFRTKQVRMPVGDFPTVFPTKMKCWLNRTVTSENGITHKRCCIFFHILSFFIDYFFCWSWACFFGPYMHILHIHNMILHFFLHIVTCIIGHG